MTNRLDARYQQFTFGSILKKNPIQIGKTDEINDFLLELSGFLRELQCPFARFISGPISDRFQSDEASAQLLDYLLGELMAAKMIHLLQPETSSMVIELVQNIAT